MTQPELVVGDDLGFQDMDRATQGGRRLPNRFWKRCESSGAVDPRQRGRGGPNPNKTCMTEKLERDKRRIRRRRIIGLPVVRKIVRPAVAE